MNKGLKKKALLVAFAAAVLVACGDDEAATSTPPPNNAPPASDCAAGFVPDPRGFCIEQVAKDECAPGTRAKIGSTKCEPVGWTTDCPVGTFRDSTGWGCEDYKSLGCDGATREAAASADCVPVGDCNAPFPPAGAIVVDDSFSDAQVDATHFKTISAAIVAAPAGATVAVESGTYAEEIKIDKSVKLVGRCAEKVVVTPGAFATTDPGILVEKKAPGVEIRGLTLSGPHIGGIDIYEGSDVTIEEIVIDGSKLWGVIVDSSTATIKRSKIAGTVLGPDPQGKETKGGWGVAAGSSTVSLDDVTIIGGTSALFSGTSDAQISALRMSISGQAPQPPVRSAGVYARAGRITLERSKIHDIIADGAIAAEQPRTIVEAHLTVIRNVKAANGARGYGAVAYLGGEIGLSNVSVIGAESIGLLAKDPGSILTARESVVRGPPKSYAVPDEDLIISSERAGIGVQATGKGKLVLDDVAIVEPWGWGAYIDGGAEFDMKHTLIEKPRPLEAQRSPVLPFAFGLMIAGAKATIEDVTMMHTTFSALTAGNNGVVTGSGLYIRDVAPSEKLGTAGAIIAGDGGKVDLDASAIFEATTSGITVTQGASALVRFANGTIHGTKAATQGYGHGVIVALEAEAIIERTAIFDSAGVGIAASHGRAHLLGAVLANNPVAIHAQDDSFVVESDDQDAELEVTEIRVSSDTKFLDNASKLGSGEIPLPTTVIP